MRFGTDELGKYEIGTDGLVYMALPNTICARDLLQSCMWVFLNCITALINLSVFKLPPCPTLSLSNLLPVLAAISARQFECGLYAALRRWQTPKAFRIF